MWLAIYYQGRILIFSPYGIPIGQIVLPRRDENYLLKSTSLTFGPGQCDIVIVSRDKIGRRGAMIFLAPALAQGAAPFSDQYSFV